MAHCTSPPAAPHTSSRAASSGPQPTRTATAMPAPHGPTAALAAAHALYEGGDAAAARRRIHTALAVHAPAFEQLDLLRFGAGLAAVEGDHDEAAALLRKALGLLGAAEKTGDVWPADELATALVECLIPYGHALWRLGKTGAALQAFAKAAALAQRAMGAEHPETAACFFHLGRARVALGQRRAGVKAMRCAYALCLRHHPSHPVLPRIKHALHRVIHMPIAGGAPSAAGAEAATAATLGAATAAQPAPKPRADDSFLPSVDSCGRATSPTPLPAGWSQHTTPTGRVFFANHQTKRTTWLDPRRGGRVDPLLPPGWEKAVDAQGIPYYIDHNRRQTQRSPPPAADVERSSPKRERKRPAPLRRVSLSEPGARPLPSAQARQDDSVITLESNDVGAQEWQTEGGEGGAEGGGGEALPSWHGLQRRGSLSSSVVSWDSVSSLASAVSSLTRSFSSASLASLSSARALFRAGDADDDNAEPLSAPSTPLHGAGGVSAQHTPQRGKSGATARFLRRGSLFGGFWDSEDAGCVDEALAEHAEDDFV